MLLWGKAQGIEVNPVTAFSVSQWMDLGDKLLDSATQGSKEASELLTTWCLLLDTLKELKQQQAEAAEGDGLPGSPGPDSEEKARLSTTPTSPVTKDSSKPPKSVLSDTDKDPRHFLGKLKGVKKEHTYVWLRDQKKIMKDSYTCVWPRDQIKAMKDSHEKTALGYVRSREGPSKHRSEQCVRPTAPLSSITARTSPLPSSTAVPPSASPPLITVQPSAPPLSVAEEKNGHFFSYPPLPGDLGGEDPPW